MLANQVLTLLHRQLLALPKSIYVDVVEDIQGCPAQRQPTSQNYNLEEEATAEGRSQHHFTIVTSTIEALAAVTTDRPALEKHQGKGDGSVIKALAVGLTS